MRQQFDWLTDVKNLAEGTAARDDSQFKFRMLKTSDAHDL